MTAPACIGTMEALLDGAVASISGLALVVFPPSVGGQRVSLIGWLDAIESESGPLPPELRHLCLTLSRCMSGDGSLGCYPGSRTLAVRLGVHRATVVSRWLRQLRDLGWLHIERRRTQYGREGGHYYSHNISSTLRIPSFPQRVNHHANALTK